MPPREKIALHITPARPRDLLPISDIDAAAFAWAAKQYPHRELPLAPRDADWFARFAERAMAKVLVARTRHDRTAVGYLLTLAEPMKTWGANLRIIRMAVRPAFHRMGVGRALVANESAEAMADRDIEFRNIYADAP